MLDLLSTLFYDPWVFWGVPLAGVVARHGLQRAWEGLRRRHR